MEPMEEAKKKEAEGDMFNELMEHVGLDGRFQTRFNYLYNMGFMALVAMAILNIILAITSPEHWCHVPGRENTNFTREEWRELTIPREGGGIDALGKHSKCMMYNLTTPVEGTTVREATIVRYNDTVTCQHGWDYDTTWYSMTISSEENWVCEKELYIPNTLLFCKVGEVLGEIFIGQMGDTLGRRPVMFAGVVLMVLGRCVAAFTSGLYTVFLAAIIVTSLPTGVIFQSPLIIGMEISTVPKRAQIAMLQCVGWTIGMCLTPMVAWATGGDWKLFMILTTLPCSIIFLAIKSFPESPRWLAARGKSKECLKILHQIAKTNKTTIPDNALDILVKLESKKEKVYGAASFFTHWRLLKNMLLISSCVTLAQLSGFTLILSVASMSGNPFLNMFLQALIELPGFMLGRFICDRFGRRWGQSAALLNAAIFQIFCILTVPYDNMMWLLLVFILVVKLSMTSAAYCAYLQCMELYPTCLRQTGTSLGILMSTLCATVAPYIVYMGSSVDARYPYAILCGLHLLNIVCATSLPETQNKRLPETIEDAIHFGVEQKFWSFPDRKRETNQQPTKA